MLDGVSGLVGGYGAGCHTAARVNVAAEIDCRIFRIVMVGKFAVDRHHFYFAYAVALQHKARHLGSAEAAGRGHVGVLVELALKNFLDDERGHHHAYQYNPNVHIGRFIGSNYLTTASLWVQAPRCAGWHWPARSAGSRKRLPGQGAKDGPPGVWYGGTGRSEGPLSGRNCPRA